MAEDSDLVRLPSHLLKEARQLAASEGIPLEQLVSLSLAEKLSVLRTEEFFRVRASKADIPAALELLTRAGRGNPPMPGDE